MHKTSISNLKLRVQIYKLLDLHPRYHSAKYSHPLLVITFEYYGAPPVRGAGLTSRFTGPKACDICACERFFVTLHRKSAIRFLGRVVRHRSAKPFTAVRFRQEPQMKLQSPFIRALELSFYGMGGGKVRDCINIRLLPTLYLSDEYSLKIFRAIWSIKLWSMTFLAS